MKKELIIVESPAKVKTISRILGKNFDVAASVGHVRDLPKNGLGVDETHGFEPDYQVIKGKEQVVKKLKTAAGKAETVYLAPDPDREGEAIAWHVANLIRDQNPNIRRIQFNEITTRAVQEALKHPTELNEKLFASQQARRILDRLVGYKLSPLLWTKIKRGISAGRVQSVSLRLIVEREKERRAFNPEEYWVFKVLLEGENPPAFSMELWKIDGKKAHVGSQAQAESLEESIRANSFTVASVVEKERKKTPAPPFITSTLQQQANRRLGFTAKKTMTIAQKLYEGLDLGELGQLALITYMRTDSVRIAQEARDAAHGLILEQFGPEYYPPSPRQYKTKGSAQDAHEAIRPVDCTITPDMVQGRLPKDLHRLYSLIWARFMASQMASAVFKDTIVEAQCGATQWRAKGERLLFPGHLAVTGRDEEEKSLELPKLSPNEPLELKKLSKEQKFTLPPPRYTEATLVKELEEKGIGRPSTYATIISTLQDRDYVRMEERRFAPTELGFTVSDQLSEHFPELMDVGFTASMESSLDKVADGEQDWVELLKMFTQSFYPTLEKAQKDMSRGGQVTDVLCDECGKPMQIKFSKTGGEFLGCSGYPDCKGIKNFVRDENGAIVVTERVQDMVTDIVCDKCGAPMVIKQGRMGQFLGCSAYPDCTNIKNFKRNEDGSLVVLEKEDQIKVGTCPECGGDLVVKRARTGSRFIACTGYPKCKHTEPFSTGVPCPEPDCDGELVEKSSRRGKIFYACNRYPKCRYAVWDRPVNQKCPDCGHPLLVEKNTKAKGPHLACPQKDCGYIQEIKESGGEADDHA
ncbi:MAG: type I DNA topoisomerase [Desulfovibrionaceae bacterium]